MTIFIPTQGKVHSDRPSRLRIHGVPIPLSARDDAATSGEDEIFPQRLEVESFMAEANPETVVLVISARKSVMSEVAFDGRVGVLHTGVVYKRGMNHVARALVSSPC